MNPYQWLVERERRSLVLSWVAVATISLLWLICWWAWPQVWFSTTTLYVAAALVIMLVGPLMTHAAARRIGQDRRDGHLELLLTTPLATEEIVSGQMAATREQFRPLRYGILGLFTLMLLGGLFTRFWPVHALVNYLLVWCFFIGWCFWPVSNRVPLAMWIGLNTGRPMMAVSRNRSNMWGWIWLVFNARSLYRSLAGRTIHFPAGTAMETFIIAIVLLVVFIIAKLMQADTPGMRDRLTSQMRFIAREPVPAHNDPRFKNWNMRERLPGSAFDRMSEFAVASQAKAAEAKRKAERLAQS